MTRSLSEVVVSVTRHPIRTAVLNTIDIITDNHDSGGRMFSHSIVKLSSVVAERIDLERNVYGGRRGGCESLLELSLKTSFSVRN